MLAALETEPVAVAHEPVGMPYDNSGANNALPPKSALSMVLGETDDDMLSSLPLPRDLLTPADLPPREAGFGDPLQAVEVVTQRADGGGGGYSGVDPSFASETRAFPMNHTSGRDDMASLPSNSLSLADATEFTLPQWLELEGGASAMPRPPLPPTRSGMATAPPVYTWCLRTTHSDVTCLMNAAQPFRDEPAEDALAAGASAPGSSRSMIALKGLPSPLASPLAGSSGAKKPFDYRKEVKQCRLPYAGGAGGATVVLAKPRGSTLLAAKRDSERRRGLNAELMAERSAFLAKLDAKRHGRLAEEHAAATRIQALWRGFCGRPHPDAVATLKQQQLSQGTRWRGAPSDVRSALRDLDAKSGLPEMPGATLPKRKRSKKVRKAEKAAAAAEAQAATVLQSRARIFSARAAASEQAFARSEAEQREAALQFQRVFRGGRVRLVTRRHNEDAAAHTIQGAVRRLLAGKHAAVLLLAVKEAQLAKRREERAATKCQALQRGVAARVATQGPRADAKALREAKKAQEEAAAAEEIGEGAAALVRVDDPGDGVELP